MRNRLCKSVSTYFKGLVLAALLGAVPFAAAALTGPVPRSLLSGGVTFSDSHPGIPQQLGQRNGKTFTFENFDLPRFNELLWGVAGLSAVKISLDGAFDSAGETLSFSPGNSDLLNGVAVWTGNTRIFTKFGTRSSNTIFRMTVTDDSGLPVSLTADARVDIIALPAGKYSAQLEMLATFSGNPLVCSPGSDPKGVFTNYAPVLRVFDCTDSAAGTTGDALTSLETGFFVEVVNVDLAEHDDRLLDHNTAVLDKLGEMSVGTSRIENDWDPKWDSALQGIGALQGKLDTLEIKADNLPQEFQNLAQQLDGIAGTEELAYLLGFNIGPMPPPGFPPIESFPQISSLYGSLADIETKADSLGDKADSLDGKVDGIETRTIALAAQLAGIGADLGDLLGAGKVDVAVVEQAGSDDDESGGSGASFVVLSSASGKPVDAAVTQVLAVSGGAAVEVDWVATALGSGLILLEVELPWALRSARTFLIQVEHALDADRVHAGSALASLAPDEDD